MGSDMTVRVDESVINLRVGAIITKGDRGNTENRPLCYRLCCCVGGQD